MAMHPERYRFLNFTNFKELVLWSAAGIISQGIRYNKKYKLVPISSFLRKNSHTIIIEDDVIYKQLTIKTQNGGVVLRDQKRGSDIGTKKQNVVCGGQFVISKIDARNGAFGIISEELDGAIVTNDFPVFDIDETIINPTFLLLVTTTKAFVKFAQSCSSGTTNRQRIDINQFLSQKIPLPSKKGQEIIVSQYNNRIIEAERIERKALQIEENMDVYLLNSLGLVAKHDKKGEKKDSRYIMFVRLKNLSRWDIYNEKDSCESNLYENVKLSDVVTSKPQYGAGFSSSPYDGKIRYIRITDINEDGSLNEDIVSAKGYSERYLLKENDFLIARSGNTVGKTFLYTKDLGKAIYAGYLIRFELDSSLIVPDYLLAYTKCSLYKDWIKGNMRVSAQPNINSQQYLNSPIILPPLDAQNEIVTHIKEQKALAKQLKQKAKEIRKNALKEFENTIFE